MHIPKDVPKEKVNDTTCPICGRKSLYKTYWGKVNMLNPDSDNNWRYCCTSKIKTSFGIKLCYFNTPVIRLPNKYKGEIDWSKTNNLTDPIHPAIRKAIDKAVKKKKFI